MPEIFRGTSALITGASRGIGAGFARALAARGTHLVLLARDGPALEALAATLRPTGVAVRVLPADLADPAAPGRIVSELDQAGITVDHLVNNAGIGPQGRFHTLTPGQVLPTIDVNVRALTELSARLLPGMVARGRGGLINIASTAAWQGLPFLPVYSASKAFVITWSEATWAGLRGTGVRCLAVSPGPVDTPFFDANRLTARPPRWMMQSAEAVVRRSLRGYERDDCHLLPFLPFRLMAWGTRLTPRFLAARLGGWYAADA